MKFTPYQVRSIIGRKIRETEKEFDQHLKKRAGKKGSATFSCPECRAYQARIHTLKEVRDLTLVNQTFEDPWSNIAEP